MCLLDFMLVIPEIFLLFGIFTILFFGIIYCLSSYGNFPFLYKNVNYLSILLLICTFFLVINSLDFISSSYIFLLNKSDYGNFTVILILALSICVFIGSYFFNTYSRLQSLSICYITINSA